MNDLKNNKYIPLIIALITTVAIFYAVGWFFNMSSDTTASSGTSVTSTGGNVGSSKLAQCAAVNNIAAAADLEKTETFGSHNNAYSLNYTLKNGWNMQDSGDIVIFYNLNKTVDDKVNITTNLIMSNVAANSLNTYVNILKDGIARKVDSKIIEECYTTIDGVQAIKVVWTGDDGAFPKVKSTNYVLEKNGKIIFLDFTATAYLYDKFAPVAEAVLASIKVN